MRTINLPGSNCRSSGMCLASSVVALLAAILLTSCGDHGGGSTAGSAPAYSYGTKISFATAGNAAPYRVSGWSDPEEQFTWTEGDTAVLAIRVPATEEGVALKIRANGFTNPPDLPAQPVEVSVNNRKIADWELGEVAEHSAILPPELVKEGGLLTFTFKMPKAVPPKAAGKGDDPRVLGMCVHEVEIRKVG
ncbi:MAG: hypothetical protein H0V56_10115 [Chthoniobacterales bacterium]|nr:hypothetical protein [Chthoniobacterales bacterium]